MIADEMKKYRAILSEMTSDEEKALDVLDYYNLTDELVQSPDLDDDNQSLRSGDWTVPSIQNKVQEAYRQLVNKYGKDFAKAVDKYAAETTLNPVDSKRHYMLVQSLGIEPNTWYIVAGKSLGLEKPSQLSKSKR